MRCLKRLCHACLMYIHNNACWFGGVGEVVTLVLTEFWYRTWSTGLPLCFVLVGGDEGAVI